MNAELEALLLAFFGGGGLVKLLDFIIQRSKASSDARKEHEQLDLDETRWTWQEAQDIMARYKDDITALRQDLASVRAEVGALKEENRTLRQEKATLQREVDVLTAEVSKLRAEIEDLKGKEDGTR